MSATFLTVANTSSPSASPRPSPPAPTDQQLPVSFLSLNMKDLSSTSTRTARNQFYSKRRPSPHRDGIQKARCKDSPSTSRRTPAVIKAELQRLRQREAQLAAYRREGIYIEEEYREDICFYMHEMEVSHQEYDFSPVHYVF